LLPVFGLFLGHFLVEAPAALRSRLGKPAAVTLALLGGAALVWTGLYAIALEGLLLTPDSRTLAAEWLRSQPNRRPSVALLRPPWYYTPPLGPGSGCVKAMRTFCVLELPSDFRVVMPPEDQAFLDPVTLRGERPDFAIANEFEYTDALRLA